MPTEVTPAKRLAADGCPGALQVHPAADGGLARIRVPGGVVSLTQWAALHSAASELGEGGLELTSRANVQIRGLAPGAEHALAGRMAQAGLLPSATHETVRNILASPLAFSPWVAELDAGLCADPELAELSGRFLFAIDAGAGDVSGLGADATVLPLAPDVVALLLAGADSGLRVSSAQAVPALLAAAHSFLAERRTQASGAWRLAELSDGVPHVTARVAHALKADDHAVVGTTADGFRWPVPAAALTPRPSGPVGLIPQADGASAVGVVAPLGRLTTAQAQAIEAVARFASARPTAAGGPGASIRNVVVVTPWRGVLIPGLAPATAAAAEAELRKAGLITDPESPWAGATACTGLPGCAKSRADVQADAMTVLHSAPRGDLLPVHWVGCERRCGRPAGAAVEVLALGGGQYRLAGQVHRVDDLPAALAAARRNA